MKDIYRRALGDMGCFTIFMLFLSPAIALAFFEGGYGSPTLPGALGVLIVLATMTALAFTGRYFYAAFETVAARFQPERFIRKLTPKNAARLTFAVIGTVAWTLLETVISPVAAVIVGFTIGGWWIILDFSDDGLDDPIEQDSDRL